MLALIERRVHEHRAAGIVVGLLEHNGRRRVIAYGDPGPGQPPLDGNSVFDIGSITKVFTATLLAEMVLNGKVKLDDPVAQLLPPRVKVPQRNGRPITLAHLAMHNSGLPRAPTNAGPESGPNPYAAYTIEQMYQFLSGYELPRDPGAKSEYSNVGFGLLGHALALVAGKPYEQLQEEQIWTPLGLRHTSITMTPWMRAHLALGHATNGDIVPNWASPALVAAGAIHSTANDLLEFLWANIHTDSSPLGSALAFAQQRRLAPGATVARALGWGRYATPSDTIISHIGGTDGYRTFIGFRQAGRVGVVVLTNSGNPTNDDLGGHLLDPRIPLRPQSAPSQTLARTIGLVSVTIALGFVLLVVRRRRASRRMVKHASTER